MCFSCVCQVFTKYCVKESCILPTTQKGIENVYIPIFMRNHVHWGMTVASKRYRKSAVIYGGDQLSMNQKPKIMESVLILFQTLRNNITWDVDYKMKWILHHDNYEKQKDSHCCGLYVISSMKRAGKVCSVLPSITYNQPDVGQTTDIRNACERLMIGAVLDKFIKNIGETSVIDVFRYITSQINGSRYEEDEWMIMKYKKKRIESTEKGEADGMFNFKDSIYPRNNTSNIQSLAGTGGLASETSTASWDKLGTDKYRRRKNEDDRALEDYSVRADGISPLHLIQHNDSSKEEEKESSTMNPY